MSGVCTPLLTAAEFSGSIRAADQFVPGATVTASSGETKVAVSTDENGRYTMDLTPGVWDVQVEMFEFTPEKAQFTIGASSVTKDWVLTMPKIGDRVPASGAAPVPVQSATNRPAGQGRGRGGQGGARRQGGRHQAVAGRR